MKFKFFLQSMFLVFISFKSLASASEQELLTTGDIHKIMDQILSQHAEKNKMTESLIKNSIKIYIDQFDPYRIYLLESEVNPYLNLSNDELQKIVTQYEQNDYAVYERLNELINKAILRAREIREELRGSSAQFFQTTRKMDAAEVEALILNKSFATSETELKNRIRNQLMVLVQTEKKRYGNAYVVKNQDSILSTYEKRLRISEKPYLFSVQEINSTEKSEKENLFVMHILKSIAKGLDAHTEFFNQSEAFDMKMHLQNSFEGVGLSLQDSPQGVIVLSILPGSAAAKSGLVKVNDLIVEIDGQNTAEMEVEKAAVMLQGKANTTVAIVIKRKVLEGNVVQDKQVSIKLKREPLSVDEDRVITSFENFGNGIVGKIKLNSFYQNNEGVSSEKDVREAIESLEKSGNLRGLILDLRDNTGGFLSQAVKVAGLFITNGVIVVSKYSNGDERFFRDMDGKTSYNGPLIVLTSKLTASAAEIVAQSLQDYGVAVIVGDEHTYGKGTVQTQTVTQNGASSFFKVTIGKYYTASGKTPQIQGVLADVTVPGKLGYERIGEGYLESHVLTNDTISESFQDPLKDIDASKKSWYLHYYIPTEQPKSEFWKTVIPTLKKNSEYRISQNKNYQMFIKKLKGEVDTSNLDDEDYRSKTPKNFGNEDLQMIEAVNVLKDMIYLDSNNLTAHEKK